MLEYPRSIGYCDVCKKIQFKNCLVSSNPKLRVNKTVLQKQSLSHEKQIILYCPVHHRKDIEPTILEEAVKIVIKDNLTTVPSRQSLKTSRQGLKTKLRDIINEVAFPGVQKSESTLHSLK